MLVKVPFEDALSMTGFGTFNYLNFMLCGSIINGMSFEILSVAYLVPASACELNTTSAQQGLMAAIPLIGVIATSHMWGYLADTKGRKKVLCVSMILSVLTGASAALSPNWIVFSILKFLSSCSVAGSYALALTLLSECTPRERRNTMIILTSSIFLSATGTMAAITIPVLPLKFSYHLPGLSFEFTPWRFLNLIFCIPCAISALGLCFAYESPKYLLSSGDSDKALETLRGIYVINKGKSGDTYEVKSLVIDEENLQNQPTSFWASMIAQTVPLLKPPLLKHTILLTVIFVQVYICINPYIIWLPTIVDGFMRTVQNGTDGLTLCDMLRESKSNTKMNQTENNCALNELAMLMVTAMSIFLAVLNVVISIINRFVGRKTLLISIQFVAGVAALCINASTYWILSAVLFIVFISGVLNFGYLSSFCVDIYPTYVKAMAVCLTLMVGRGSAVLGINVLKNLLDNNCEASFYIFGAITVLGGVFGFLLPSNEKIQEQKKNSET